ncbi:MAG: hypothetical protein IJ100_01320 [Lachnospiraceae bacterium]|nr:hypothetical protein [Lachnospiraceae bacterium]
MAKITFRGLDDYIRALEKLGTDTEQIIARSIYPGAAVIADAVKAGINSLNTREDKVRYSGAYKAPGPTEQEKHDLAESFGLAPMRNDAGYINTKAGFDGYGSHKTKSYPKGVPNALVARSCESGTSWMEKQPFMRKAVTSSRKKAETEIIKAYDEEVKKIMQ